MPHSKAFLIFDTETTGLPKFRHRPVKDVDNWPRLVQLGWAMFDSWGREMALDAWIVRPDGFSIPRASTRIHGITTARAKKEGRPLSELLPAFLKAVRSATLVAAHNMEFDRNVVRAETIRLGLRDSLRNKPALCTQEASTHFCALTGSSGFKYPRLDELHQKLFRKPPAEAHDVVNDIRTVAKCFFELRRRRIIRV